MTTAQFMNAYSTLSPSMKDKVFFGLALNEKLNSFAPKTSPTVAPEPKQFARSTDNLPFPPGTNLMKVADYRAHVVGEIWEEDLDRQLVDRIVYAVVTKMISHKKTDTLILRAEARKKESAESGRKVVMKWMSLGKWFKEIYEQNGIEWKPVKGGREPEPVKDNDPVAKPVHQTLQKEEETHEPTEEERASYKAFTEKMRKQYAAKHADRSAVLNSIGNPEEE